MQVNEIAQCVLAIALEAVRGVQRQQSSAHVGCANFYNGIFTSSFSAALHQIFYASHLQSSLPVLQAAACCYLLQMFKVSLFIIYAATVLDFLQARAFLDVLST